MKVYALFVLLGLIGLLSCWKDPCPPNGEPVAQVRFTAPTSQTLTDLTIVGLQSTSYKIRTEFTLERNQQALFYLPLDMNAPQTRYTFRLNNRVDTLVVNYDSKTTYAGQGCGYYLFATRPVNRAVARSTVGLLETVVNGEPAFADTLYGPSFLIGVQLKVRIRL